MTVKSSRNRSVSILLSAVLFTGCASVQNAEPTIVIETKEIERTPVTVFTDDSHLFPAAGEIYRANNDPFVLNLQTAGVDGAQELRTLLMSGNTPDLVYLSAANDKGIYAAIARDNALYDLTSFFTDPGSPQLYEGVLDGPAAKAYGDARITGAPMAYECAGLLAKAKRFAGENALKIPASFDSFLAIGSQDDLKLFGYPLDYPAYLEPLTLPLTFTLGESTIWSAEDCKTGTFTDEKMNNLSASLAKLSENLYFAEDATDTKAVYTAFKEDHILFIPGDATTPEILRNDYGMQDEILLLPAPSLGDKQYLLTACTPAYIPASAAQPEEAKKILSLVYGFDAAAYQEQAQSGGFVPPLKGSAEILTGFEKAAAKLFEDGVIAYCGKFLQEDKALLKEAYTAYSNLIIGISTPDEWAETMEKILAEKITLGSSTGAGDTPGNPQN